ncbi:hypothetical protein MJL22_27780, partial [Salmonella enterica subsp. enterica serovar Montevideo]|nr:hypothetical protein [Salmonella enterica subsp. enterica serovar Montevideo]
MTGHLAMYHFAPTENSRQNLLRENIPDVDTSRPIMYVLPYNSKADLLTLRAQCLAHDLPDPLEPLEIDGA